MKRLTIAALVVALMVIAGTNAQASLSWQTTPILGIGGSSDSGDLVIITGPQPFKPGGEPYYAWPGGPEVLGPTIPHYSIDEPAHGGDNLYHVGDPSMTLFWANPDTWEGGYWVDKELEIHAGSGVNLTAGNTYSYLGTFTYLGPNATYSIDSAKNDKYVAPANFIMLHSSIIDLWLEDVGLWKYTETWTEVGGGSITYSQDFEVRLVPEPATILVWGLLGLIAAGYGLWRRKR